MARTTNYGNQIVAGRVAELITMSGMTMKDVCKFQPCERSNAYRIIDGIGVPSFALVAEVSRRSGKSLEWIINGEG